MTPSPILAVFFSQRMLLLLLMGFSSGLPLALTAGTLQAWMTDARLDIKAIAAFSLVRLPYTLKFIWAPLLDRYVPPFLGRRRGWMAIFQALLMVTIVALGSRDPAYELETMAVLCVAMAFFSASQDIVIDAYRAELLEPHERGAGSSIAILGYRLALLVSGSLALIMADSMSWAEVYTIMAGFMLVGVLATLAGPESPGDLSSPPTLREAVLNPFVDYFKRNGAWEILAFIVLYKVGDVMAGSLSTTFLIQMGFTKTEIGAISKGAGLFATIFGAMLGGGLMVRLGLRSSLLIFGILQAVSTLGFAALATYPPTQWGLAAVIVGENLSGGMGTAASVAFLISLCNKRFTATQYALLTSLAAVSTTYVGAFTGHMVEALTWGPFFVVCALAALPGIALAWLRFDVWSREEP